MKKSVPGFVLVAALAMQSAWAELPAVKFVEAPPVDPATALSYFAIATNPAVPITGFPRAPELVALAHGLGSDEVIAGRLTADDYAKRVYEYVYANIHVDFMFGSQKGPLGALIDQSGTPFDQASLMIELLRQANVTANYELGTVTLTATQAQQWFGLTNGVAVCKLLANGGIPSQVNGTSSATCAVGATVSSVQMLQVWVSALGKRYDPSFKVQIVKQPIDLAQATQCGATGSCTGSIATTKSLATSAATSTANVTPITGAVNAIGGVAQSTLETQLTTWAMNLKAKLDTVTYRDAATNDIVGGLDIDTSQRPASESLPYTFTSAATWATPPNQYRTSLRVRFDNIDRMMFTDELGGRRLRVYATAWANTSNFSDRYATLNVEWQSVGNTFRSDGSHTNGQMLLTINHPYAANAGAYMDETITNDWLWALTNTDGRQCGLDNDCPQTGRFVATIVQSFGSVGSRSIAHYSELNRKDTFGANLPVSYPKSISLGNVGLAQWCDLHPSIGVPAPPINTEYNDPIYAMGDSACTHSSEAVQVAQWVAQLSRSAELVAAINNTPISQHHSLGVLLTSAMGGGSYLNVESSVSATSGADLVTDRRASIYSYAQLASRLEGSINEQLSGTWEGGAAVSLIARYNAQSIRFAQFGTLAGFNQSVTAPKYSGSSQIISDYLNAGFNITVADTGAFSGPAFPVKNRYPTSPTAPWSIPLARPFLATHPSASDASVPDRISFLVNWQTGMTWKGAAAVAPDDPVNRTMQTTKLQDASLKQRKSFTGDVSSGALTMKPLTDLVTGIGDFPMSLDFTRSYDSRNSGAADSLGGSVPHSDPDCNSNSNIVCTTLQLGVGTSGSYLGGGWDHNWNISASITSDAFQAMGEDSPVDAVGTITALYALRALTQDGPTFGELTTSVYVANWFGSNLTDNAVVVKRPPKTSTFVRLPDGSFNPPSNSNEVLKQTNQKAGPYGKQPDLTTGGALGLSVVYDYSAITYELTDSAGTKLSFALAQSEVHGGDLLGFKQFKATQWTFPTGLAVTFAYDLTTQPHCLKTVSNNLGRSLTFDYEIPAGIGKSRGVCYLKSVTDESSRIVQFKRPGAVNAYGSTGAGAFYGGIFKLPELQAVAPDGSTARYLYTDNVMRSPGTDYTQEVVGRISSVVSSLYAPGDSSQFMGAQYDSLYRLSLVSDALGNQTSYFVGGGFGENLHRGDVRDPLFALSTSYFDRFGAEVQRIDPNGRISWKVYDARQRLSKAINPEGDFVQYAFDARHNTLSESRNPKPNSGAPIRTTTYSYMEAATVTSCTTAATCNELKTITDPKGNVTTYDYYSTGQVKQIKGPTVASAKAETDICYTTVAGISFITGKVSVVGGGKPNRITTYSYKDATGKYALQSATIDPAASLTTACAATTKSSPLALVTTFTFDGVGNVSAIDGPRTDINDVSNYAFDANRRLTRIDEPATLVNGVSTRGVVRYTYNLDGTLLTTRRALIGSPTDSNPADPRPADLIAAQWQTESRTYWSTGDLKTVTDAANDTTQYIYDAVGRTALVIDPDGRGSGTVYDPAGQTTCSWRGILSGVAPTDCNWDPSTYASAGPLRYVAYTYTANGHQKLITDADNNQTELVYDSYDRLRYTFFPNASDGTRCTIGALPAGVESGSPTCTASNGKTPTYEDIWYTTDGTVTGTNCNGADQPCRRRTRKAQTITYTYDAMNRVATKTATGLPKVTNSYNLLSEPTSLSTPSGGSFSSPAHSLTYDYDDAGRKLFEKMDGRQVSYGYTGAGGQAGERTSTTWPDGYFVSYDYDARNRMQKVWEGASGASKLAEYAIDILGRRQSLTYANNASNRIDYTYEPDDNLDLLTNVLNTVTVTLDHGHNRSGQITSIDANLPFFLPTPAGTSNIAYVPNKLNQYNSVAGQAQTYDASGNLLTWFQNGVKQTYTYDSENRLRTAATDGTATASVSYDYDPLGRRITKTVSGVTTGYLLDGEEEIAEYSVDATGVWGAVLRRYITGPSVDERIARAEGSSTTNPTKTYYHVNHQGSVIATANTDGSINQQLSYDVYGNLTSEQPPASTTGEAFRYTGRRYDPETGLYYYRARYYSAQMGRFLQVDPIGYQSDYDLYAYVGNDPLNRVDPSGLADSISGLSLTMEEYKKQAKDLWKSLTPPPPGTGFKDDKAVNVAAAEVQAAPTKAPANVEAAPDMRALAGGIAKATASAPIGGGSQKYEKAITFGRNAKGEPVVTGIQVMDKQGGHVKGSDTAESTAHLHYKELVQPPIGGDNNSAKNGKASFVFGYDGKAWEVGQQSGNSMQRTIKSDGTPGPWKPFGSQH